MSSKFIDSHLDTIHRNALPITGGSLPGYLPELARIDPEKFGIALCSADGQLHRSGDVQVPFTLQSVSKPFVYALALEDVGVDHVHRHVGAEPSGEAFDSVKLQAGTGRPPNPMVNAGAIATSALVIGKTPTERFGRIRAILSAFAGRELGFDSAVFESEVAAGHRNRAVAYLMQGAGSLVCSVDEALDTYFRQCSMLVTTSDLAVMGGTLANGGVNPVTRELVVSPKTCERVLTIMATCGMYDYAGEWLLRVGLPAKSGVAGGLVAVSPGRFGLGLFSPRLDGTGASVRAVSAAQEIADLLGLHVFRPLEATPIRSRLDHNRPVIDDDD